MSDDGVSDDGVPDDEVPDDEVPEVFSTAAISLPTPVRDRALALAADTLGVLPSAEVPSRLRAVARFAPARRARQGAGPLATALDTDPVFLARVAELARVRDPELAAELDAGRVPAAADVLDVAALAYVLRVQGWEERVRTAQQSLDSSARSGRGAEQEAVRLRQQLEALRVQGRVAVEEQRTLVGEARAENASLRRAVADARREAAAAEVRAREAAEAAATAGVEADRRVSAADSEVRRLRDRAAEIEQVLETSRRTTRQGRSAEDVRLRLLLDTLVDAAAGLRRELALPPVADGSRPGDLVAEELGGGAAGDGTRSARSRALLADDPAVLDQLLALPRVHLVVDGYNVTKTGYGSLPLEAQRARLLTGLAGLAARTAAEVTCVFDGATLDQPTPAGQPRGVRVLFSPAGITADSVIRQLVRAEPPGRAVVVVSSDREVADGVAAVGARPVASMALVRRLDRG